jgi:hypothetical protein
MAMPFHNIFPGCAGRTLKMDYQTLIEHIAANWVT